MLPFTKPSPNRYSKVQPLHKYLTLDFKQDHTTFGRFRSHKLKQSSNNQGQIFFSTFYNKQTQKPYRKHLVKSSNGRQTAMTNRDSVIGTPFNTLEFNDPENNVIFLPSLDMERYKYLLKAISGISKTKRIPQFKQLSSPRTLAKKDITSLLVNQTYQSKQISSPKVLNLQVDFSKGTPFFKAECQNAFQKAFKNKRLLLKRRRSQSKEGQIERFDMKLLGQDELQVMQVKKQPKESKKQKKTPNK